jgi:hypothetical protein
MTYRQFRSGFYDRTTLSFDGQRRTAFAPVTDGVALRSEDANQRRNSTRRISSARAWSSEPDTASKNSKRFDQRRESWQKLPRNNALTRIALARFPQEKSIAARLVRTLRKAADATTAAPAPIRNAQAQWRLRSRPTSKHLCRLNAVTVSRNGLTRTRTIPVG